MKTMTSLVFAYAFADTTDRRFKAIDKLLGKL